LTNCSARKVFSDAGQNFLVAILDSSQAKVSG
jgi:hypothetical protein